MLKKDMPEVYHILKVVGRFVSDYRIVEWRNDMIGHGALPFEDSDDFIYDMRRLSRGIDECLEETIEDYEKIDFEAGRKCGCRDKWKENLPGKIYF